MTNDTATRAALRAEIKRLRPPPGTSLFPNEHEDHQMTQTTTADLIG
jgi:hypothetical protein